MKISRNRIKELNPCSDRYDNYVKHYGDREFTVRQFMGLKNITHRDKVWVAVRLVDKNRLRFLAADIAESVLHIFESKYPNDDRPRKAIEAARTGAAAYAACADAAAYAAYAAAYAAYAYAAYAAAYAAYAACAAAYADAAAANAAYAAANADKRDEASKSREKEIRTILIKYMRETE